MAAAASLGPALEQLADTFEGTHPGAEVRLNLDSSTVLAEQILGGAPADVFASADERTMTRLADTPSRSRRRARSVGNSLSILVPPGNPGDVAGLDHLERGRDRGPLRRGRPVRPSGGPHARPRRGFGGSLLRGHPGPQRRHDR
ncbi:MAG: extracellular solute-binding protein [Acidimicrobiia bacterium]|nr:extracellular solute-binding protein [Acidimicrobiia bacterium]